MNRNGNLIWWLVCIGFVAVWVLNLNSPDDSGSDSDVQIPLAELIPSTQADKNEGIGGDDVHSASSSEVPSAPERLAFAEPIDEPPAEVQQEEVLELPKIPRFDDVSATTRDTIDFTLNAEKVPMLADSPVQHNNTVRSESKPYSGFTANGHMAVGDNTTSAAGEKARIDSGQSVRVSNPYVDSPAKSDSVFDPILTRDRQEKRSPAMDESHPDPQVVQARPANQYAATATPRFEDLRMEQTDWVANRATRESPTSTDQASFVEPLVAEEATLMLDQQTIQQCINHIEYGRSLARRGATFAAREEFFGALRLVAQSFDVQSRSNDYTTALGQAITALNEADDFYLERPHEGIDTDVAWVIDAHQTKIITPEHAAGMSSATAVQLYLEYAREQLRTAFGETVVASESLYSLGKLFSVAATHDLSGNPLDFARSTVMHYAAIDADPGNHKSANELGVLLARNGNLEKARDLFLSSLLVEQVPQTWKNLAMVHEQLAATSSGTVAADNRELARKAIHEYEVAISGSTGFVGKVQWLEPNEFSSPGPQELEFRTARLPGEAPVGDSDGSPVINRLKHLF